MATLTVSDIAKRIKRPDEPLTAAADRLRNWTKMGIIKTAGAQHPGTGRRKQYDSDGLLKAVVLQTLSDAYYGAPVTALAPTAGLVARILRGRRDAFASKFLVLPEGEIKNFTFAALADLPRVLSEANCGSYVLIGMWRFLERAEIASPKPTERKRKGKDTP